MGTWVMVLPSILGKLSYQRFVYTYSLPNLLTLACQTPNQILQMNDIPDRHSRNLPEGTSYPLSSRYTLQWLADDNPLLQPFSE